MKSYADVVRAADNDRVVNHVLAVARHEGWGRYEVLLYATLALVEANAQLRQQLMDVHDRRMPTYLACPGCPAAQRLQKEVR